MDILVQKHVMAPMRDGVRLAADVYRPASGGPFPALLTRLPYSKDALGVLATPTMPDPFRLAAAGYAVVVQDVRGTSDSEGVFEPVAHEAEDGVDAIAWIVRQAWCDGTVAMFGASYLGFTQWLAASQKPPALKALAPTVTSADFRRPWYHSGGPFELATSVEWSYAMALAGAARASAGDAQAADDLAALSAAAAAPEPLKRRLPHADQPLLDRHAPWHAEWLAHPGRDDYWLDLDDLGGYEQVSVPAFQLAGWYDIFLADTLASFAGMRGHGGSETARATQRLIVGPWAHALYTGDFPDRFFGAAANLAALDVTGLHLRFFDEWMKGRQQVDKPVRIFVMGVDEWRDEDDWPLPDTRHVDYFLDSAGHANTGAGDGRLGMDAPGGERSDTIRYDPADPVPTLGGAVLGLSLRCPGGPFDQTPVEARADVLCYTTLPLTRPLEVTGHVEAVVFVSSSALDTDLTAKLVDVFPDGRAINLTEGGLRLRYRDGPAAQPLTPGEVYQVRIELAATSNVFLPGHRVRLELSSSNFPRFDRNTNTGGDIAQEGPDDFVVAVNTVHHGPSRPSRLILPVIERR